LPFPCAPDLPADQAAALWAPELAAATVVLDSAPPGYADARHIDLSSLGDIVADQILPDGRHVVLADGEGKHRVWLRETRPGRRLAFVIAADSHFSLRAAVAQRFHRRMRGLAGGSLPAGCRPTPFQRSRLILLLNLLDAEQAKASRREMASVLVYRGMAPLRGAEWKGSNERRRTQRLVEEAIKLRSGGYRALLGGG